MNSNKDKFNTTFKSFVNELRTISPEDYDLKQLATLLNVSDLEKDFFIRNFQKFFLREIFVKAILTKDANFFITYNFNDDEIFSQIKDKKKSMSIFLKIKEALIKIQGTYEQEIIFKYITTLIFYSYKDINIDPSTAFQTILNKK